MLWSSPVIVWNQPPKVGVRVMANLGYRTIFGLGRKYVANREYAAYRCQVRRGTLPEREEYIVVALNSAVFVRGNSPLRIQAGIHHECARDATFDFVR